MTTNNGSLSVTSSTAMRENKPVGSSSSSLNKRKKIEEKPNKRQRRRLTSMSRMKMEGGGDGMMIDDAEREEEIKKVIPLLADAFASGYFTEVNCRSLPESVLDELAHKVYQLVQQQGPLNRSLILASFDNETLLNRYVHRIYVVDFEENSQSEEEKSSMNIILYRTKDEGARNHEVTIEGEKINIGRRWTLPHQQFESLWESLQFDLPLKCQLMQYVFTVVRFAKANIDRSVVHCNQTVLLYGPPGCGKTSLCKGLAQKVSIRMKELFVDFFFYELNAASMFSKWFSESSHNVCRFFDDVARVCLNPRVFVFVLIDEIESISVARKASLSNNEPSDLLRVVNTLLTQLDRLKSFSNVLVLTTSNLLEAIDGALLDRADIVQFIAPPSIRGTFNIYTACLTELVDKGLVSSQSVESQETKEKLVRLSKASVGLSGRTLRKLPMLAFSRTTHRQIPIDLDQLIAAVRTEIQFKNNTEKYLQQVTHR